MRRRHRCRPRNRNGKRRKLHGALRCIRHQPVRRKPCEDCSGLELDSVRTDHSPEGILGGNLTELKSHPTKWDLIITDLNMPEHSGLDLVTLARQVRGDLPVLVMSGLVDARIQRTILETGDTHILRKPWSTNELTATIAALVGAK
jgi:DNA-binding response OmpR family regulator